MSYGCPNNPHGEEHCFCTVKSTSPWSTKYLPISSTICCWCGMGLPPAHGPYANSPTPTIYPTDGTPYIGSCSMVYCFHGYLKRSSGNDGNYKWDFSYMNCPQCGSEGK